MAIRIIGTGSYAPEKILTNADLEKMVETSDEWITTRTGIKTRRICVDETNVDLAEAAARRALGWEDADYSERRIDPEEIDLIVYSTATPDVMVPTCAALLRRRLGLVNAAAFDMNAACTGFIYGLTIAESMMAASAAGVPQAGRRNPIRRALVVGGERLTRITNWKDRNTCVLFGDGAGAAVVEWDPDRAGILSTFIRNDDDDSNALTCPMSFDAPQPFSKNGVDLEAAKEIDPGLPRIDEEMGVTEAVAEGRPRQTLYMHGQKVFKFAVEALDHVTDRAYDRWESHLIQIEHGHEDTGSRLIARNRALLVYAGFVPFGAYDLLTNNCEHFVRWCKNGKAYSGQVANFFMDAASILTSILLRNPGPLMVRLAQRKLLFG